MRILAYLIDTAVAAVLAGVLSSSTGWFFAERAAVTFRVYSPHTVWNGPVPLMLGAVSTLTYGFAFAWLLVVFAEALSGVSAGKIVTGLEICAVDGRKLSLPRAWLRWGVKTAPLWLFCLALLAGRWQGVVLALGAALWTIADLVYGRFCDRPLWHDRLAKSQVLRRGLTPVE